MLCLEKNDYKKAFKKLDHDELIIIIESLKERIDQLEQEKKQQKIKSKSLTTITIKENFKKRCFWNQKNKKRFYFYNSFIVFISMGFI